METSSENIRHTLTENSVMESSSKAPTAANVNLNNCMTDSNGNKVASVTTEDGRIVQAPVLSICGSNSEVSSAHSPPYVPGAS